MSLLGTKPMLRHGAVVEDVEEEGNFFLFFFFFYFKNLYVLKTTKQATHAIYTVNYFPAPAYNIK